MSDISNVNYGTFNINYKLIESHLDHAPMKATSKHKIWEKKIYELYKSLLTPEDSVIDAGAYIGTHSLPMSKLCKQVYSFEPNPEVFEILTENVELNNITNVLCYSIALSNDSGRRMFDCRNNGTSRFFKAKCLGEIKEVETLMLDEFLPFIDNLKLIKIDVESAEFDVLDGATDIINKHQPYIIIEAYQYKNKALKEWCKNHDYGSEYLRGDNFFLYPLSKKDELYSSSQ
jgi:FkbM family methyltransferase